MLAILNININNFTKTSLYEVLEERGYFGRGDGFELISNALCGEMLKWDVVDIFRF